VAEYLTVVGIDGKELQQRRTPARNLGSLAALFCEEVEGKRRGGEGGFIGTVRGRLRQGLTGIEEGSNFGRQFPVKEINAGKKMAWQMGPSCQPKKEEKRVPVREGSRWAAGLFPFLGRGVPEAFFYFFLFFLLFYFCFPISFVAFA
jgi:hypothetical protein